MKKFLIPVLFCLASTFCFSQTKIGSYSSGSFTIDLTSSEKLLVFDTISARFKLSGCTLDSVVINDQDPSTVDSAAYMIFYMTCDRSSYTFGLYLTKDQDHGNINYLIDTSSTSTARAWKCDNDRTNCETCDPVRNWFLGPVVDCSCHPGCWYSSSGNGVSVGDVVGIAGIIISIINLFHK